MAAQSVMIRLAEARDDVAVGELLVRAFVEGYAKKLPHVVVSEQRKADLRAVAAKRQRATVWVAEHDGRVVGTVALWAPGTEGSEAWLPNACDLRHLAVLPEVKGQGVAKALLDVAEAHAKALKASSICLHVRRGAAGVKRLYESRGYVREPSGDLDKLPEVFLEALRLPL